MRALKYFLFSSFAVFTAVFFVLFALQNDAKIRVHLFNYSAPELPVSGYLLLTFLMGIVFSILWTSLFLLKINASKSALKRKVKNYEKELQQLRNLPLEGLPHKPSVEIATLVEKEENTIPPNYLQSP